MHRRVLKSLSAAILAICLPNSAYSDCMLSTTLGEYVLGDLGYVDPIWENFLPGPRLDAGTINWDDTVTIGDYTNLLTGRVELAQEKNRLMHSCETNGNALVAEVDIYFDGWQERSASLFDENCPYSSSYCEQIREMIVEQNRNAIDAMSSGYRNWLENDIVDCKRNFETVYDVLVDEMCH